MPLADELRSAVEIIPISASSRRRCGWRQPIVTRRTGKVIAGNTADGPPRHST